MAKVLSTRLKLWFALAAVALIATSSLRYVAISNVGSSSRQAGDIRDTLAAMDSLLAALQSAQAGQVEYLVSGNEQYLAAFQRAEQQIAADLTRVARSIDRNPEQSGRLVELRQAVEGQLGELKRAAEAPPGDRVQAARQLLDDDADPRRKHRAAEIVAAMKAYEQPRLDDTQRKNVSGERLHLINFLGMLGFNLLLLGLLFFAVRADAAQRAQAKAVLEHQELRLRRVVESNVIGIVLADAGGQLTGSNDAFLQMLGYCRADLDAGVIQRAVFNAPEYADRTEQALAEVRRSGKCAPYKKEYVRKDGTRVPVLVGAASIDDQNGQLVLFVLDLTEHREAEAARAKLVAIAESSNDAIISLTLEGMVTTWNHDAQRLFGYAREQKSSASRSAAPGAARHRSRAGLSARSDQTRPSGGTAGDPAMAKSGRPINVSLTIFPLRDSAGQVIGAAEIVHDITAQKQAEIERERLLAAERAARSEAERIGHIKDEFLATLSHELRTPLNVILGWIHLLTTTRMGPEETAQALEVIRRSARSQTQLIEDLLDMSRIVSGKLRMDVQRVELVGIIDAAIEAVRPAAEAKGVQLLKILDPTAAAVMGDPNRLQQIAWNLLSNAVKFTPRGGRVEAQLTQSDGHVQIEVSDTGQGIPLEFLPHVFERFRQADASTTRRHTGLGLGLAIVRHLVELHGGSVIVVSGGEGQGASFTVSLPALAPEEILDIPPPHPVEVFQDRTRGRAAALAGVRILVVDDERREPGAGPTAAGRLRRAGDHGLVGRRSPDRIAAQPADGAALGHRHAGRRRLQPDPQGAATSGP